MTRLTKRVNFFRSALVSLKARSAPLKEKSRIIYKRATIFAQARPLWTFFGLLLILLAAIVVGNFPTKPKVTDEEKAKEAIEVETYSIGQAPLLTIPAQIENEGVIQIEAQASAIISKINVKDGQSVKKGQLLISLASNYQGGNAASVQRQLAGVQAQTARITFDAQKDIIAKQREIAEKADSSADDLRDITEKSQDETKQQVNLNESILSQIEANINQLEASNVGGSNDALILQTKQLQSQFLAATNQARSALRAAEFQTDENKAPTQLSNLTREVTTKQLDLQEKTSSLSLEAANLQAKLAQISEATFFPVSPFTGTVERVHVRASQRVSPGDLLVTVSTSSKAVTAVAYVPQNIAQSVSKLSSSVLTIDSERFEVAPIYISSQATSGQLYSIVFEIPQAAQSNLTDKSFIDVQVPIGYSYTSQSVPYVPLDSVHQTQDTAVVFTVVDQKAHAKTVSLGQVQGNFIEITSGLEDKDVVILNRNIVAEDSVKVKSP